MLSEWKKACLPLRLSQKLQGSYSERLCRELSLSLDLDRGCTFRGTHLLQAILSIGVWIQLHGSAILYLALAY